MKDISTTKHDSSIFHISDSETFKECFSDKALTQELLELILDIEIDHIEFVQTEVSLTPSFDARGIRMDVYVKDGCGTIFNVEMQTYKEAAPLKRARYYQATIDVDNLKKGSSYRFLPMSYIIFICSFDMFGAGLLRYNVCDWCKQLGQSIDDIAHEKGLDTLEIAREIIFLNASAAKELPSNRLEAFLSYVSGHTIQEMAEFDFARRVEQRRETLVNNREWRSRRMNFEQALLSREIDGKEEGMRLGLEQGLAQGREQGLERGLAQGREQGLAQGREQTIRVLAKEFGFDEEAARRLLNGFEQEQMARKERRSSAIN